MPDYDEHSFGDEASAGYWLVYYSFGAETPPPEGPFDTVREMAEANDLYEYPLDGYVVYRGADGSMSTVPSLNPDDLLYVELAPGVEEAYRKFYNVPDFDEVDRVLVAEWYDIDMDQVLPG